jgi:hypothetical protein
VFSLDGQPASEIYSRAFGYPVEDWAYPPLNELARLYPLGLEQGKGRPLLVRSPLAVQSDGSLRMHTVVPEGATVHLMVGSAELCLQATRQAATQALQALNGARPVLALALVDTAWQNLLETRAGSEIQVIREVLGADVPVAGGYGFGQVARGETPEGEAGRPELYNQSIEVIVFGEPQE